MKKTCKKIYPISMLRIVWLMVLLLIFIVPSIAIIIGFFFTKEYRILELFLGIIIGGICIIEFFWEIRKSIIFEEEKIHVLSDKTLFFRKIQYEVAVEYKEINTIKLVATNSNSKNQSMFGGFVKMPYIVLICKDGDEKMINLYYYNKKQSGQIIDEIRNRVELQGNNLEIPLGKDMIFEFLKTNK